MKKNCSIEEMEDRIVRALKNAKSGLKTKYLVEAINAEFCYRQFCEALGNLQMRGKVAFEEDRENYVLA